MLLLIVVSVVGLNVAQLVQAASVLPHDADDEAVRLATALAQSSLWPAGVPTGVQAAAGRVRRGAPEFDEQEHDPEAEAEEVDKGTEPADGGQPPATGLRRWVIRVRNFMFGRRDLEGSSEDGEAEGQPEEGRTWAESLAHWFAHGIKRILVRISGGEEGGVVEGGEGAEAAEAADGADGSEGSEGGAETPTSSSPSDEADATPATLPVPVRKPKVKVRVPAKTKTTTTTTSTAKSWTALPPLSVPGTPTTPSSGTVYDDEAFPDGMVPPRVPDHILETTGPSHASQPPVDETNELS